MKLIQNGYEAVINRDDSGYHGPKYNKGAIAKTKSCALSSTERIIVNSGFSVVILVFALISPILFVLALLPMIGFVIWQFHPIGYSTITSKDVHSNLRDEFNSMMHAAVKLDKAKQFIPEGALVDARSHQFKDICYKLATTATELAGTQMITDRDANGSYWTGINDVRLTMEKHAKSGLELGKLVAANKISALAEDVKFYGVDQYADDVSIETMTYRSLGTGE